MAASKTIINLASPPLSHLSSIHVLRPAPTNINYRKKELQKRRSIDHIARKWFAAITNSDLDAEKGAKTIFSSMEIKNRFTAVFYLFRFSFHLHLLYGDGFVSMHSRTFTWFYMVRYFKDVVTNFCNRNKYHRIYIGFLE